MKNELNNIAFFFGSKFDTISLTEKEQKEFVQMYNNNEFSKMQTKLDEIISNPTPDPASDIVWINKDFKIIPCPEELAQQQEAAEKAAQEAMHKKIKESFAIPDKLLYGKF